jgi:large subunit ribosomal protein L18
MKTKLERYTFRRIRVRKKIFGTSEKPRLSVYRSLKHVYAQIIDDIKGRTLVAASSREKGIPKASGIKAAGLVGDTLAKRAVQKGIKQVVFDRGARPYMGQVKALGDSARQGGLKF